MNNKMNVAVETAEASIRKLLLENKRAFVAIDGMSGSGKTTLAAKLAEIFNATVIHMDDYFPQPEQRTYDRMHTPGGNLDVERLLEEVYIPISKSESFTYKPFNCKTMEFDEARIVDPQKIIIAEGSYSCHPKLIDFYDLKIFLYTTQYEQAVRILNRNGFNKARTFSEVWIPLEDEYFNTYKIKRKCDLIFKT